MTDRADDLTHTEREILAFEQGWWKYAGAKKTAVRERFGLTYTRYHQVLNALIDHPAALRAEPTLVRRLASLRESRARQRQTLRSTPPAA